MKQISPSVDSPRAGSVEQRLRMGEFSRHRHTCAYAAIVVSGSYLESGDTGRWVAGPGDVVFHQAYEAHGNTIYRAGATVINVVLPDDMVLPPVFRVSEPDLLWRMARAGSPELLQLLSPLSTGGPLMSDWPDILAADLRRSLVPIGQWARMHGLAPATVSRGFMTAFGTTPARYRAEVRARSAWRRIVGERTPLVRIAYDCEFADQAHLCRSISALTGMAPSRWRRVKKVQDSRSPPS